jgi:hypothetical protein
MWEPRPLTNLWTSTACYRDRFAFYMFNISFTYSIMPLFCIRYEKLSIQSHIISIWILLQSFSHPCLNLSSTQHEICGGQCNDDEMEFFFEYPFPLPNINPPNSPLKYGRTVDLFQNIWDQLQSSDHSGRAVEDMKCIRPLEHWDRGFESHSKASMSMYAFILCLCCPVCR